MTVTYLVIPLYFIALMIYVSWPLLKEPDTTPRAKPTRKEKGKQEKR